MTWKLKQFHELSKEMMYQILKKRVGVFVVEQECPYPEIDGIDDDCLHLWKEEDGDIKAYCRLVPPQKKGEYYAIGRVLVIEECRGTGLARELMNRAIDILKEEIKVDGIQLHGQEHLRYFYQSFGFKEVTDVYLEDGIPHVDMVMELKG
ncbi:GNAT family N-acetyltransferase [Halobacillus yeomjeoni]|uniref:GNAT family N-acetyltransferase n=1 Tax=Halobacillus yeomjeoni TaxID=311194 RepID=UPI001CD1FA02|nr:GNAT family N-acetyltransferase [Halobacillus yeomjeoni]MCA0985061.1 GNAT family N-acetyltransferase [Halobacillus yeomjeoni]